MPRLRDAIGLGISALAIAGVSVSLLTPSGTPALEDCIRLWNGAENTARRELVSHGGYTGAEVEAVFSEGRYEGCAFLFARSARGGPALTFFASRLPAADGPLRFDEGSETSVAELFARREAPLDLGHAVTPAGALRPG